MANKGEPSVEKLRAWWWQRQGLHAGQKRVSAAEMLKQAGWARSVGGCAPYMSLFARVGLLREDVDQAVAQLAIHELPSARACTYVVPESDYGLALHLARQCGSSDLRTAEKLGVTAKEVDTLCGAVLQALKKGALDPDGIRDAVGGAVRSLGAEGQKKGMSSTLPLALGILQRGGEIRRVSTNGRLDNQRYHYALWQPNPLGKKTLTVEEANAELAQRYFAWIGPASVADFQLFAGISGKAAKAAVAGLELEALDGEGKWLMPASLRADFEKCQGSKEPHYRFVMAIDSFVLLRRDDGALFDAQDTRHPLLAGSGGCGEGTLMELSSPAILDRGRIAGLWEYDPETESIAYATFNKKRDAALKKAVSETENYIRTQLGDARTFSLDSPKSRAPRIKALREQALREQ